MTVSEVIARRHALAGQRVRVRGSLLSFGRGCTLGLCVSDECCNKCTGALGLLDPKTGGPAILLRHHMCHGDDSKVCCQYEAAGEEAVVVGRLVVLDRGRGGLLPAHPDEPWAPYAIEGDTASGAPICSVSVRPP